MNWNNMDIIAAAICCFAFVGAGAVDIAPHESSWGIGHTSTPDSVQLRITKAALRGYESDSIPIRIAELEGLRPDQLHGLQAPVHFTLKREAGTFVCDGVLTLGKGSGR